MKLRLPLPLKTAVMAGFVSFAVLPSAFAGADDIIISEGERTEASLTFDGNPSAVTLSGTAKLTVNGTFKTTGGSKKAVINLSGNSVLKVNELMLADSRAYYTLRISENAVLDVAGNLRMFECCADGDYKNEINTFTIDGGTVKAKTLIVGRQNSWGGINIPGFDSNKSGTNILAINGGVLNVGSGGVSQCKQTQIIATGGTLGVLDSDWSWEANVRWFDGLSQADKDKIPEHVSQIFLEGNAVSENAFTINTEATQAGTNTKVGDGKTITLGATLRDNEGKTGGFKKTGAGTLILTAANTYSGGTVLDKGTLEIKNIEALGSGRVTVSGGTLALGGFAVANIIEVTGDSVLNGGSAFTGMLQLTGGALTGEGLNLAEGTTARLQKGSIANVLSGEGGIIKESDGTVLLTGTNSYAGGTEVAGGVLQIGNKDALGAGNIVLSGGTLDMAGFAVGASLEVTGDALLNGGSAYENAITVKSAGTLTLGAAVKSANIFLESGGTLDTGAGMMVADYQTLFAADGAFLKGNLEIGTDGTLAVSGTLDMDGVLTLDGGTLDWIDREAMKVKGLALSDGISADVLGLSGGVSLIVGSAGITGTALDMGNMVLGASADWNTVTDLVLTDASNALTVRTEGEDGTAYSISLDGAVSGVGRLTKTGAGTLTLGGANGYAGDTLVSQGSLYLGNDTALGATGKLKLSSGTFLAAVSGKSIAFANNVELGKVGDETYNVTFGQAGQTDSLTLQGDVNILASGVTLTALASTELSGVVSSNATSLIKNGNGSLTFSGELKGVDRIDVSEGKLGFASEAALAAVKTLNMASGTSLNLGGVRGDDGKLINVNGTVSMEGASSYAGAVAMIGYDSRLNVTGDFSAGQMTFQLGLNNAVFDRDVTLVTTSGTAEITGTAKDSIILNFDVEYLNRHMNSGGKFQLFSKGLTYNSGTVRNNQRQLVMVDESNLSVDGSIIWGKIVKNGNLIDQDHADKLTVYIPSGLSTYLGAESGTVTIGSGVQYDLEGYDYYNLTPGRGTLVYKGVLTGEQSGLYIADYADVTEKAEDHSTGSVILSNNANNYGRGTNISGATAIVDLSQDAGQNLDGMITGRTLKVNVLGTGEVEAVSGTVGGSHLILQAYGDAKLDSVDRYVYENTFYLSGNSILEQRGANVQELSGDITSGMGQNVLANSGDRDFVLTGNIRQNEGGTLVLENTSRTGNLVLSGQGKTLSGSDIVLGVRGGGQVLVKDGYGVQARGVQLMDGNLVIASQGRLAVGQDGITGTGKVTLNGGTLTSASSWKTEVTLVMSGAGQNIIDTTGANVFLNGGVTGDGGFLKKGTGDLYVYGNGAGSVQGVMEVLQGKLILFGAGSARTRSVETPGMEYQLNGDLVLDSGKGASLMGMIDANGHNVTFGDRTHFYLEVTEDSGMTGYIRNAGTITIGSGTQLHVDVLDDSWITEQSYTVFSANDSIQGAGNLELVFDDEFAFVDVTLDQSKEKEIGLILTKKGSLPTKGLNDGTNKGAIHAVVAPLAAAVLDGSTELTGKMKQHMQKVSKMTTTEYQTYLTGMGNSASSFYTALSAQVQDATQHINSVRNRVELINPVMYDDWTDGGIYNVWAGGINHYRDVKSNSEAPGYEMTSWGGELGCAIPLSQTFMIGVGFAYTFTDVQVKDGWGNNDNDTYSVDLFARYRKDALTITGVLTGGFTNTEFHRNQILKDEIFRANSSTDGNQFLGTLEVGYDFYLNEEKSWILQPLVNLTAGRAKLDSLGETGDLKNAGLMIGSQSYNMFSAGIGAKIAYQYKNSVSDLPGRVELKAMYVNDMGDVDYKVNGRFIGAPENSFNLDGVSNERSAAIISAGWIAPISAYGQFFVDAGCEFRKDQNGVNTTIGFSFQF